MAKSISTLIYLPDLQIVKSSRITTHAVSLRRYASNAVVFAVANVDGAFWPDYSSERWGVSPPVNPPRAEDQFDLAVDFRWAITMRASTLDFFKKAITSLTLIFAEPLS